MRPYFNPEWGHVVGPAFGLVMLAVFAVVIALLVVVWWRIFSLAGYSGALGLLMLVPVANLIVLLVLAFSTWPIEEELRRLRAGQPPVAPAPGATPPDTDPTPPGKLD